MDSQVTTDPRGYVDAEASARDASAFRRDGFLVLEEVLDPMLVDALRTSFDERHAATGRGAQPRGSLRVGDRRYMVTVRLRKPFVDPRLFASPRLLGTVTELLGDDRILFSFGAVVSQPGSGDQHVHSDGGRYGLFGGLASEGDLPPYAITVIVPLVDMNDLTGTTRVYPGSHRMGDGERVSAQSLDPVVRVGSVLLMDYRLHHGGLANRSAAPRPILSLVYARAWYRDPVNFAEQPPLLYGPLERRRMPPELSRLLPSSDRTGVEDQAAALARRALAKARASRPRRRGGGRPQGDDERVRVG